MTGPIVRGSYPTGSELDEIAPAVSRADLRSGVVALKAERRKASEHPAAGKTQMTPVRSLPKIPKKPKRPKR